MTIYSALKGETQAAVEYGIMSIMSMVELRYFYGLDKPGMYSDSSISKKANIDVQKYGRVEVNLLHLKYIMINRVI